MIDSIETNNNETSVIKIIHMFYYLKKTENRI